MKKILIKILFFLAIFTIPSFFAFAATPIKILIVPGHDNEVWGAQYGNIKEADMNLRLGAELSNILKKDKRFQVHITRDKNGYTKEFADYFGTQGEQISAFKENAKKKMQGEINSGTFTPKENPPHNAVNEDTAIKLYGFNKWANENKIDAVVHIHFNDIPRKTKWTLGKYRGFAVYKPESQMANARGSGDLAQNIFTQLKRKYKTSNYPPEENGLVPDQKLIALGANGTLISSVRSVLIEYGYIYRFRNTAFRQKAYKNMADLTARGIRNYFFNTQ